MFNWRDAQQLPVTHSNGAESPQIRDLRVETNQIDRCLILRYAIPVGRLNYMVR